MGQTSSQQLNPDTNRNVNSIVNSLTDKHKFILITSKSCGYCTIFKDNHGKTLNQELNNIPNVDNITIEIPTMSASQIKEVVTYPVPKNINRMVGWYPFILMVSSTNWKLGLKEDLVKEQVDIYNPRQGMNTENIINWVKQNLLKEEYNLASQNTLIQNQTPYNNSGNNFNTNNNINTHQYNNNNNNDIVRTNTNTNTDKKYLPTYTSVNKNDSNHRANIATPKGQINKDNKIKIDSPNKSKTVYHQINFVPRN